MIGQDERTIIVNDACCLIDLRKGGLLLAMLRLPFRFLVPLPVRVNELLDLTPEEWGALDAAGLETFDLPSGLVSQALAIRAEQPKLSANDCFCLATTQAHDGAILLTGDALLRRTAAEGGLRVHGVLWIADQLREGAICAEVEIATALEVWRDDPAVFLPRGEIESRLRGLNR